MTTQSQRQHNEFQYPQSIGGIAERVAAQLGDHDPESAYGSFSKTWIIARIQDTMKWFQGRNPSLFAATKCITLKPGFKHDKPEDCDQILSVDMFRGDKGREIPTCEADYKDIMSVQRLANLAPRCMTDFNILHYAINPGNPNQFVTSPALFTETEVEVTCSDLRRFTADPDKLIDCAFAKYINAVVEFVVWQAQSSDSENVTIAALADQHRVAFFDLSPTRPATKTNDSDQ